MAISPYQVAQVGLGVASSAFPPLAVAQGVLGAVQAGVALSQLQKLRREKMAQYSDNLAPLQQNVRMYEQAFNQGLPQAYSNQAYSAAAGQNASAYRRIQDMGGGQLSNVFSRISGMDRIRLAQSLAGMNADYRRQAMSALSQSRGAVVGQMNLQTQADRSYRLMREQALGGALKAGTQNLTQAIDFGLGSLVGRNQVPQTVPQTVPQDQFMLGQPGPVDYFPPDTSYDFVGGYQPKSPVIVHSSQPYGG